MKVAFGQLLSSKRFILLLLGMVAVPLAKLGINLDTEAIALMLSPVISGIFGYSMKDTESKTSTPVAEERPKQAGGALMDVLFAIAILAALGASAIAISSCGATKAGARAAASAFEDCTGDAVQQAVNDLAPALRPMILQAASVEVPDLAPLRGIAKHIESDVRRCVVVSVAAGVAAFIKSAPVTMSQRVDPARVMSIARDVVDAGTTKFHTKEGEQ